MHHDLTVAVAEERRRQLLAEAAHERLARHWRPPQGRHRQPAASALSRSRIALRRVAAAVREIATMPSTDPASPRLRDYPLTRCDAES
jgi:hypothetical protein